MNRWFYCVLLISHVKKAIQSNMLILVFLVNNCKLQIVLVVIELFLDDFRVKVPLFELLDL